MITALAVITGVAVVVLWAFYGFRYSARPAGLALSPSLADYVRPLAPNEAHGILLLAHWHLLPESYLYGLADVRIMANDMPSFLLGRVYAHGTWMYFPIDFLIKSTLSMLALLALTLFAITRRWLRPSLELAFVLIPPILYMLVSMGSHLNIGARHILARLSLLLHHHRSRRRRSAPRAANTKTPRALDPRHHRPAHLPHRHHRSRLAQLHQLRQRSLGRPHANLSLPLRLQYRLGPAAHRRLG